MRRLVLAGLVALFELGCGDGADGTLGVAAPCDSAALERCDLRDRDCADTMLSFGACVRQSPRPADLQVVVQPADTPLPPSHFLRHATCSTVSHSPVAAARSALALIGLVDASPPAPAPPTAVYISGANVIVLRDSGEALDSADAAVSLQHAFVHALQDREVGVDAFYGRHGETLDRELAAFAILDGEAAFYGGVVALTLYGGGQWPAARPDERSLSELVAASTSPLCDGPRLFAGLHGRRAVTAAWQASGQAGVGGGGGAPPPPPPGGPGGPPRGAAGPRGGGGGGGWRRPRRQRR